jgi:heterodisulfide reductase subunit C
METSTKPTSFLAEVAAFPGGEKIRVCMQCGNCTASCPNADKMEHTPAELIAMIGAGLRDEVLSSNTPWRCLACYCCTVRCPRGVKITDLMHAVERLAFKYHKANRQSLTPTLYRSFNESIYSQGRIAELSLMVRFYMRTNPFRALRSLPLAWGLLSHKRLLFSSPGTSPEAKKQIKAILDKAASLGGQE